MSTLKIESQNTFSDVHVFNIAKGVEREREIFIASPSKLTTAALEYDRTTQHTQLARAGEWIHASSPYPPS